MNDFFSFPYAKLRLIGYYTLYKLFLENKNGFSVYERQSRYNYRLNKWYWFRNC